MGKVRFAPVLRYTRWDRESIYPRYATKPDQVEILASLAYQTDSESRRVAGRQIGIGAIAGIALTRGFDPWFGDTIVERQRYLVGLAAEVSLKHGISVEVNAIYKPLRAGSDTPNVQTPFSVLTWQFPTLVKYRFARPRWTPFAEAGPSFRLAGNLNGYNPSHHGVTVGAGIETRARDHRLSTALRYTRWAEDQSLYRMPPGVHYDYERTNSNQVELVFGVSF